MLWLDLSEKQKIYPLISTVVEETTELQESREVGLHANAKQDSCESFFFSLKRLPLLGTIYKSPTEKTYM